MIKRIIKITLVIFLLYFILGAVLPLLRHKPVNDAVRQNFSAADCYADETGTERVLCIDDNEEALIWRIRVIETAREEIILSTFDYGDDESGWDIMALLLHAADRGVHVRMLVDGFGGVLKLSGSSRFKALVSHPNVEVKFYNVPNPFLPWKMTLRLHTKFLIADDSVYILGGRNTNTLFLGNYREDANIDRDLLVYETGLPGEENSMSQLKDYFAEVWSLPDNKEMMYADSGKRIKEARDALSARYAELERRYPEAFGNTDYDAHTMETNKVTLLTGPPQPVNKEPVLWYKLCRLMSEGEEVVIQTPYIICGREMYEDLDKLCDTADVELIVNAVEAGANPWGCADYLNQKDKIRELGPEIYEFMGEHSSHTKMILIDERLSMVGSYNLDMRSTYLDTEMMLAVDCEQLNRDLRVSVEQDKARSKHISPDGRFEFGGLYEMRELSFGKKVVYGVLRIVTVPVRHLL